MPNSGHVHVLTMGITNVAPPPYPAITPPMWSEYQKTVSVPPPSPYNNDCHRASTVGEQQVGTFNEPINFSHPKLGIEQNLGIDVWPIRRPLISANPTDRNSDA